MVRTQIQLTEDQVRLLRDLASEEQVSMAELIRRSVDQYLRRQPRRSLEEQRRQALSVVGKYASGVRDTSSEHDRYLAEAFAGSEE